MNQLPENSLRIYDVTLVPSYLIGLGFNVNMLRGLLRDVFRLPLYIVSL